MLRLRALGELRLTGPAGELLPGRRKELVLLVCLAQRAPRPVRRAEVVELLWGDREEKRARHSLRQALLVLRRTVGDGLAIGPETIALAAGVVELDLSDFDAAVAAGRYAEAVDLWGGDFLRATEDVGGEAYRLWMEAERERARHRLSEALEALIAAAAGAGHASALAWAERWVELLPLDEGGHQRLVEALHREGRTEAARARHAEYVARLRRELGVEPSATFMRLADGFASEEPGPVPRGAGSAAVFSPDLVGRDAPRAELRSAWNVVSAGRSAVIVVEGVEGMGKTRLCDEFLGSLDDDAGSAFILQTRAREEGRDVPWGAARELLAGLVVAPGLAGADDADLAELIRLVPAIRERWPHLPASRGDTRVLRRAVAHVLAAVAHEMPVLVFLDDVSWADAETHGLIMELARQALPGVLLLATAHSERGADAAGLAELARIPGVRRLKLHPLGVGEIEALLGSMLELAAADRRTLAARLHGETGGNPFFASEIVSAMVDEGDLAPDARGIWRIGPVPGEAPLPLPSSVRDAIGRRLARLTDAARQVAAVAATLDEPIDRARLRGVTKLAPAPLEAAMDELLSRRLLRHSATSPAALEFVHPIIRRVAREAPAETDRRGPAAPRRGWSGRRAWAGVAVTAALALSTVLLARGRQADPVPILAVGPVEERAPDSLDLAGPIGDMLATNLARIPGLQVISNARMYELLAQPGGAAIAATPAEAARRAGAGELLEGALRGEEGRLRLELRRVDPRTGGVRGSVAVEGADAFELADRATAQIAEELGLSPGALRIADVTTRSVAAYRSYDAGLRQAAAGDLARALGLFQAALAEDSLFALAALYSHQTALMLGRSGVPLGRLDSLAARAPERERLRLRVAVASGMNDPRSVTLAESLAVRYPAEPDGHQVLANALVYAGDFLNAIPHLWRVIALDSVGMRSNRWPCRGCLAHAGLATAYTLADSAAAAERVAREWIRFQPGEPDAWPWLGVALAAQGRHVEAITTLRTAAAASQPALPSVAAVLAAWIQVLAGDFAAADPALAEVARTGLLEERREALWYLTISLRTQGRLKEALEVARQREAPIETEGAGLIQHRAQILFELGRFREAARLFDSLATFPDTTLVGGTLARYKTWLLTHLATTHAAAGDTVSLSALLGPLRAWGARSAYGRDRRLHHYATGLLLAARGRLEEAAGEFGRAIYSPTLGYTRTNYELGRTLLALGRSGEAVAVLEPALRGLLDGSNLYITRTELHELLGRAHEAAGQPDSAAVHYRAVLSAWHDADPQFHARRDSVSARLAALGSAAQHSRPNRRSESGRGQLNPLIALHEADRPVFGRYAPSTGGGRGRDGAARPPVRSAAERAAGRLGYTLSDCIFDGSTERGVCAGLLGVRRGLGEGGFRTVEIGRERAAR